MNKIQMTTGAKKILVNLFENMSPSSKDRLGRDIKKRFDEIITGEQEREFKITESDIAFLINQGGYNI